MAKTLEKFKAELLTKKGVRDAYEDQKSRPYPYVHFLNDDPATNSKTDKEVEEGDYWITDDGLMLRENDKWVRAGDSDSLQSLWETIYGEKK